MEKVDFENPIEIVDQFGGDGSEEIKKKLQEYSNCLKFTSPAEGKFPFKLHQVIFKISFIDGDGGESNIDFMIKKSPIH